MVNPNDFLLNTDYEMDKIVLVKEGKIELPSPTDPLGPAYIETFPHNLQFRPLVFGFCSYNKDFSVSSPTPYYEGTEYTGTPQSPIISNKVSLNIYVEGSDIVISYRNANNPPKPIYYRIYAFEPTTENAKVPPTKKFAQLFTLNTDRNYRKIYKQGVVPIGTAKTIEHNFGYVPQVMAWYDYPNFNGRIDNNFSLNDTNPSIYVTDKKVEITFPTYPSPLYDDAKIHYRIYCDET